MRSLPQYFDSVFLGMITIAIITVILVFFLSTDYGQAFIAAGDNPVMAKSFWDSYRHNGHHRP